MMNYRNIIDLFFLSFLDNTLNKMNTYMCEEADIDFSTVGKSHGFNAICDALRWDAAYTVKTTTITNEMSYYANGYNYIGLIAHHMVAEENGVEFYPVCFGGKYVFEITNAGLINKVSYAQEYQSENTYFLHKWKLAKRISDLEVIKIFELNTMLNYRKKNDIKEELSDLVKIFFWALDSNNLLIMDEITTKDVTIKRPITLSCDVIEIHGIDHIKDFIRLDKQFYPMNQYSISIRNIKETDKGYLLTCSHLQPYRLGTKKLNANTKYTSFYDEDINILFQKEDNTIYKIKSVEIQKITEMHVNGFEILHC